jgi:AAA15 family ATPase/GTPase
MRGKLTSLGVRGFRALRNLEINGLGAVNLLVGKNNTGKTTVLEAL